MLSMFPLYIFSFHFQYIIFPKGPHHNGNKVVHLFSAIPVTIDFLIVFCNSITILQIIFLYILYDDKTNLPT